MSTDASVVKLNDILTNLKNIKGSKKFNPSKKALKEIGVELPISKNGKGLSVDFANTKYLYPAKGKQKNIVRIKLTGDDNLDIKLANKLAGFIKRPLKYTWHHLDDYDPVTNTCTMQLVETIIHIKCNPHIGAVKMIEEFFNFKYLTR
ncbi:hypothetical protein GV828_12845 [Flavobacterium sp. NST-5]|uniref:Uncharacterized protein n=1 Tax=Flavobacterium ichthyis TaxID=2698827 RepID=A0ABW9ZDA1_9FLAO|nr:HNH endonuclease [Flavobacterium ichthyis]NBL66086.1 hypothetical protein [Flavobacterium ichthyis]